MHAGFPCRCCRRCSCCSPQSVPLRSDYRADSQQIENEKNISPNTHTHTTHIHTAFRALFLPEKDHFWEALPMAVRCAAGPIGALLWNVGKFEKFAPGRQRWFVYSLRTLLAAAALMPVLMLAPGFTHQVFPDWCVCVRVSFSCSTTMAAQHVRTRAPWQMARGHGSLGRTRGVWIIGECILDRGLPLFRLEHSNLSHSSHVGL